MPPEQVRYPGAAAGSAIGGTDLPGRIAPRQPWAAISRSAFKISIVRSSPVFLRLSSRISRAVSVGCRRIAGVEVGLAQPLGQRPRAHPQPARDRRDRSPFRVIFTSVIADQPDRLGLDIRVIPARHRAIFLPNEGGVHETRVVHPGCYVPAWAYAVAPGSWRLSGANTRPSSHRPECSLSGCSEPAGGHARVKPGRHGSMALVIRPAIGGVRTSARSPAG